MRDVELLDRARGLRGVRRRDFDALDHFRDAPSIAVDDDRRDAARGGRHAVRFQVPNRLRLDLGETAARRAPDPRQIRGQLVRRVQRPLIVAADDDDAVAAAERRFDDGDESLSSFERADVDSAAIDQRLHECVAASDEDRNGD